MILGGRVNWEEGDSAGTGELNSLDWQFLATLCVVNLRAFLDKGAAALVKEDTEVKVHLLTPLEMVSSLVMMMYHKPKLQGFQSPMFVLDSDQESMQRDQ